MNDATPEIRTVDQILDDLIAAADIARDGARDYDDGQYAAIALYLCNAAYWTHEAVEILAARHDAKNCERAA